MLPAAAAAAARALLLRRSLSPSSRASSLPMPAAVCALSARLASSSFSSSSSSAPPSSTGPLLPRSVHPLAPGEDRRRAAGGKHAAIGGGGDGFGELFDASGSALPPSERQQGDARSGLVRGASVFWADQSVAGPTNLQRRALLSWSSGRPASALLVMKQGDPRAAHKAREVADFLKSRGLRVFAERAVVEGRSSSSPSSSSPLAAATAAAAAAAATAEVSLPSFADLLPFDPRGPASTSEEEEEQEQEGGEGRRRGRKGGGNGGDEARRRRRVEEEGGEGTALAAATAAAAAPDPASSESSSRPLWSPRGTGSGAGSGAGRGAPLPPRGGARSLSSSSSSSALDNGSSVLDGFDDEDDDPDFCVTLGGDGTVLSLASLFDVDGTPLPPVLSLAMGTLGFLTPFDARQAVPALAALLSANEAPVFCTLRTRKICTVLDSAGVPQGPPRHVLNECLIDRGSSPAIVALEVAVDGAPVTTVAADGVIVATPSGSTAYSLSAGGPLVAPSVPATLLTPVAPHSLSFRPLVLPELAELRLTLPVDARCGGARVTFDGRHATRLPPGGCVVVATARAALPCITHAALDLDWWEGLVSKLAWNAPIRQPGGGAGGKGEGGEGGEDEEGGGGSYFGGGA